MMVTETVPESAVPNAIHTQRLILQSWQPTDADELLPVLEANRNHLSPWIPAHVATPVPVPLLAKRLAGFASNFSSNKEWRYAIRRAVNRELLGEVALFPRSADGRVPLLAADRAEIGYWLRSDANGQGFATEAAAALLGAAAQLERFAHVEIRCDPRNVLSAAVPKRMGFALMTTTSDGTDVFFLGRDGFPGAG
ncbi:MAG: GNAT family N-acetyltransferase [Phycisphaerae bacterium]|nr:GNAT family N-acetyltransferase [Gemmatimonadaceae bacterium]